MPYLTSATHVLPAGILSDCCALSEKGRSGRHPHDRAQFQGLGIAVVPLIVSFTQLHAARDLAGASACRAVSFHDLACSGRVCDGGWFQRWSGLWWRDSGVVWCGGGERAQSGCGKSALNMEVIRLMGSV